MYELGQKEIIVKDRLRKHVDFWKRIGANQFILDTIENGCKIPFYSTPQKCFLSNNKSALVESIFVRRSISDLLDKGLIEKCIDVPTVVNPLSVSIPNNGKKRLILDLRAVNRHVWKQSVKYEDLRLALMYLERDSWMIKFDIHSAYHFLDIYYPHTDFLGFSFMDIDGKTVFFKFLVLPFGLGVAPYLYTKFMRPLIAKWRGEGKKVILFLDDGFGNLASYNSTKSMSNEIKSDLIDSGLIPKADKSLWEPVQILEWLGVVLNSKEFIVYIPERRVQKALSTIHYLVETRRVPVKTVASFVGQIISMSVVFGPLTQIMTRYLSIDVLRARTWSAFISLLGESRQQLLFWQNALVSANIKQLQASSACSRIVYSDASSYGFGGYEVNTVNGVSHGVWSLEEMSKSSTWRELSAVLRVMKSLVHILKGQRVKWFSDNQAVGSIINKGSMNLELQDLAISIFNCASVNSIYLETEWLPRTENFKADYLSKIREVDDWSICDSLLDMIQTRWGPLEVDFFASEHNAKLPVFFSRFWCEKSSGVDAFTVDWACFYGLFVPPVHLVARVLKKMQYCGVKGVLIIPEWRSASFWPLLCDDKGHFRSFVQDMIYLPTKKEYYKPCRNGVGIFGNEDLKFNMLALYMNCCVDMYDALNTHTCIQ